MHMHVEKDAAVAELFTCITCLCALFMRRVSPKKLSGEMNPECDVFWPRHLLTDHRKVLLNYSSPQGQMFIMPQLITATLL